MNQLHIQSLDPKFYLGETKMAKPSGTQSIQRAAQIMRDIASSSTQGLRVADIAAHLRMERPTVHRMLKCLVDENLVMQDPKTRRYFLGHGLFELGLTAAPQFKLREMCRPSLQRLAEATGDIAFFTIRSGNDALSIERVMIKIRLDIVSLEIGVHRPLGVGAGSLAILMSLPDAEIEAILSANSKRLSSFGNLNVPSLLQVVKTSQEAGFAIHDGRLIHGISGVGLLVRNSVGTPLGAISVSVVASELSADRVQEILLLLRREARVIQNLSHEARESLQAAASWETGGESATP